MADSFYIGAYWGSRGESIFNIVNKTMQVLIKLSEIDSHFLNWYQLGMSKRGALEKKISFDSETIENSYLTGIKRGELDDDGFIKHGFKLGLWSGHKEEEASSISFFVGDVFKTDKIKNNCIITIPEEGAGKYLLHLDKIKSIINTLVNVWDPDYAVLTSHNLRDTLDIGNRIGWVTYIKSMKRNGDINNEIIRERCKDGMLFYLNLPDNRSYDYDFIETLESLKSVI